MEKISPKNRIFRDNDMRIFLEQFDWAGLMSLFQRILGVLVCLTVHETCHGLAA